MAGEEKTGALLTALTLAQPETTHSSNAVHPSAIKSDKFLAPAGISLKAINPRPWVILDR
jgi:hypothetical protein